MLGAEVVWVCLSGEKGKRLLLLSSARLFVVSEEKSRNLMGKERLHPIWFNLPADRIGFRMDSNSFCRTKLAVRDLHRFLSLIANLLPAFVSICFLPSFFLSFYFLFKVV